MTSLYELSKQLAEAGFPQPDFAVGQVWWVDVSFHPDFPKPHQQVVVSVDPGPPLRVTNRILGTDGLMFGTQNRVYCPTAEDFLSMLKPLFGLEKTASGRRWVMRGEGGDFVIGFRDAPAIDILAYEFLNHPEYFNKPVKS